MRILQVLHDFLPKHRAGAEIYTCNLCRELAKRHKVHLFFTEHRPATPQYSRRNGVFDGLTYTEATNNHCQKRFEETYNNLHMDKVFCSVLDYFKPDVIHFQHLLYHSTNYPRIALERGVPSVMTLHDFWPICEQWGKRIRAYFQGEALEEDTWAEEPFGSMKLCDVIAPKLCARCFNRNPTVGSRLKRNLSEAGGLDRAGYLAVSAAKDLIGMDFSGHVDRLYQKNTDSPMGRGAVVAADIARRNEYIKEALSVLHKLISPSRFLAAEMDRFGYPEEKLMVLDNGFRTESFADFRRKPSDRIRFGYIGTVAELKGVHVLVRAFRLLGDDRAVLDIYGNLSAFSEYSQWLKELAGDAPVNFRGGFEPEKVAEVFADLDVLVVPSIWFENSPLVIHEAFLSRTPVIASRIGGMIDLLGDGQTGLLFSYGNVEDLAGKMRTLIENRDLLAGMGESAPHVASIADNALELERVYGEALASLRQV